MQIKFPESYIAIDLETNGFSPEKNQIIEIGALRVEYGKTISTFNCLVKAPITPKIEALTGITAKVLSEEGVDLKTALQRFQAFLPPIQVAWLGHNIFGFDLKFLFAALKASPKIIEDEVFKYMDIIDTAVIYKAKKMGEAQAWNETHKDLADRIMNLRPIKGLKYSLEEACKEYQIRIGKRHRALEDAKLTHHLYQEMCLMSEKEKVA